MLFSNLKQKNIIRFSKFFCYLIKKDIIIGPAVLSPLKVKLGECEFYLSPGSKDVPGTVRVMTVFLGVARGRYYNFIAGGVVWVE